MLAELTSVPRSVAAGTRSVKEASLLLAGSEDLPSSLVPEGAALAFTEHGSAARFRARGPEGLRFAGSVMAMLLFLLGACGDPAAVLPARPTPVPTLARLPSVTPVPPTPSLPALPPTALPAPATPEPLLARVAVVANLRAGPGTEHPVLDVFEAGVPVRLLGRSGAWYQVQGPGEQRGWMAAEVLEIDPATVGAVPEISP